jgi:peptidoglycan/LPS O-acetylase OafA/YrhL
MGLHVTAFELTSAQSIDPAPNRQRFECLDAVRGIAALVVFFQHVLGMIPVPTDSLANMLFRIGSRIFSGAAAVDLFFVLSGFVLTLPYVSLRSRQMDCADFLVRRVTRLYPAFWIAVVVALIARMVCSEALHASALTDLTAAYWVPALSFGEIVRTLTMLLPTEPTALNTVYWSLIVEMQVSLLLPFFIPVVAATSGMRGGLLLLTATGLISVTMAEQGGLQFLPLFILGSVLAKSHREILVVLRSLSRTAFLSLLLLSFVLLEIRNFVPWRFPDLRPEYLSGLGASLLIVLVLARFSEARCLVNPVTRVLGTSSYSFYLLHSPVLLVVLYPIHAVTGSMLAGAIVALLLSLAISQGVYLIIEKPGQEWGRSLAKRFSAWIHAG